MLSESNDRLKAQGAKYRMVDAANGHLTVRAIKRLADGALGSRGAWLLEPYADLPTSTGLNTYPIDQLGADRDASPRKTASSSASTRSAIAPTARR